MRHTTMNVLLLVALALPAAAVGQEREAAQVMTERQAASVLLDDPGSSDVWRAIGLAVERGPRAGQELRTAVIEAGWAEVRREADARAGVGPVGETDPDLLFMLFEAAEALRDPRAIPLMIEALMYGMGANALADLGAAALPAVLAAVNDPGGHPYRVSGGLTALRFMVEDGSLNTRQLGQVRGAAQGRLSGTQGYFFIDDAVRLALALGDPELHRTVERIAADRVYAERLVLDEFPSLAGSHAENTNYVQARARLFLAGGGADIEPTRRRTPPR